MNNKITKYILIEEPELTKQNLYKFKEILKNGYVYIILFLKVLIILIVLYLIKSQKNIQKNILLF